MNTTCDRLSWYSYSSFSRCLQVSTGILRNPGTQLIASCREVLATFSGESWYSREIFSSALILRLTLSCTVLWVLRFARSLINFSLGEGTILSPRHAALRLSVAITGRQEEFVSLQCQPPPRPSVSTSGGRKEELVSIQCRLDTNSVNDWSRYAVPFSSGNHNVRIFFVISFYQQEILCDFGKAAQNTCPWHNRRSKAYWETLQFVGITHFGRCKHFGLCPARPV